MSIPFNAHGRPRRSRPLVLLLATLSLSGCLLSPERSREGDASSLSHAEALARAEALTRGLLEPLPGAETRVELRARPCDSLGSRRLPPGERISISARALKSGARAASEEAARELARTAHAQAESLDLDWRGSGDLFTEFDQAHSYQIFTKSEGESVEVVFPIDDDLGAARLPDASASVFIQCVRTDPSLPPLPGQNAAIAQEEASELFNRAVEALGALATVERPANIPVCEGEIAANVEKVMALSPTTTPAQVEKALFAAFPTSEGWEHNPLDDTSTQVRGEYLTITFELDRTPAFPALLDVSLGCYRS